MKVFQPRRPRLCTSENVNKVLTADIQTQTHEPRYHPLDTLIKEPIK